MGVMLGSTAVTKVWQRIENAEIHDKKQEEHIKVFVYEKRQGFIGEYIVINHLPFIHEENVENGIVNINIHVPKLPSNQPDTKRLKEICTSIIELFPTDTFIDGAYYSYYCDSRPTEDNDNTYYVNLQVKVRYENLTI